MVVGFVPVHGRGGQNAEHTGLLCLVCPYPEKTQMSTGALEGDQAANTQRPGKAHPFGRRKRPETLFFLSGGHKCGTSWVSWMLDAHPEVLCRAAARFIGWESSVDAWFNEEQIRTWGSFHTIANTWIKGVEMDTVLLAMKRAAIESVMMLRTPKHVRAVGDKTPMFYLRESEALRKLFPDAKLIAVLRDGRDACVSHAFHMLRFSEKHNWASEESFAGAHAFHNEGMGEEAPLFDEKVMRVAAENWLETAEGHRRASEAFGEDYLSLRYEDLLEDPYRIRGAFEHLGVESSDEVLEACVEPNRFEQRSGGRKPGEADPTAFSRKGVAGDWKNHFRDEDKAVFKEVAGAALIELGYEDSDAW